MGFDEQGNATVKDVVPDGPANDRSGDQILAIEGTPMKSMTEEQFGALKQLPPGARVKISYRRGEGDPAEVTVTLVRK